MKPLQTKMWLGFTMKKTKNKTGIVTLTLI